MVSSVSSERAFSSAGITICKKCNQLNGNIVEALQCLKALLQQDISLRFIPSVASEEMHLDNTNMQTINHQGSASDAVEHAEDWTWDEVGEDPSNGNSNGDNGKVKVKVIL
jgi:hypothetical protein